MAKSLRAWGRAAGIIDNNGKLTRLSGYIFRDYDPFLERVESVALLHWLIASNVGRFTATAWVFNFLRGDFFSMREALTGFKNYLASDNAYYSEGTLRGDIDPVLRMHTSIEDSDNDDRFFSQIGLLTRKRSEGRTLFTRTWEYERIHVSSKLLLYSLFQSLAWRSTASSALSDLYMASGGRIAPGTIWGFTRDGFFAAVEQLDRDPHSGVSLSVMPGEDALLSVNGDRGVSCARGDLSMSNSLFFKESH